ncbi:MAG: VF530 family DNA-binding protein [Gammaproteobacteria bacterium]
MNDTINYQNNPLHGVGLKQMVTELVEHYGFEILHAYLNINCFKTKPSIASSVKFLKKTDWAREKVEAFYLYRFKSLPRASDEQFLLPPRERVIPDGDLPGAPAELSLEDAERLREKRETKAAAFEERRGKRSRQSVWADAKRSGYRRPRAADAERGADKRSDPTDPWAKARERRRGKPDG